MQEIGPGTPSGQRRRPGRGGGTCTGASQTTQGHMEPGHMRCRRPGVLWVVGVGVETPNSLVRAACYAIRGLDYLLATYLY